MKSKSIIIKSNTNIIFDKLVNELSQYPNIRFFSKKINGEKTLIIKCYNYYNKNQKENINNFYGNYTYLYTCVSLILTDLITINYEHIIVNRILHYNYFYFGKSKLKKINNIISLILNYNSPLENTSELLLYRKQIILATLLKNFHYKNHLQIDGFVNFSMKQYYDFLEELILNVIQLSITNSISIEYLNILIKNIFDY